MVKVPEQRIEIEFAVKKLDEALKEIKKFDATIKNIEKSLTRLETTLLGVEKGYKSFRKSVESFGMLLYAEFRWIAGFRILNTIESAVSGLTDAFLTFDHALRQVQAITLAYGTEAENLRKTLLNVAKTSVFSFKEIGRAAVILAQAGLTAREVSEALQH